MQRCWGMVGAQPDAGPQKSRGPRPGFELACCQGSRTRESARENEDVHRQEEKQE